MITSCSALVQQLGSLQGLCMTPPPGTTRIPRKPGQCVISTSRGFLASPSIGNLWLHNFYVQNVQEAAGTPWAAITMIDINGTNLYMTDVTLQGSNDALLGPSSEDGLRVSQGKVFMSGTPPYQSQLLVNAQFPANSHTSSSTAGPQHVHRLARHVHSKTPANACPFTYPCTLHII